MFARSILLVLVAVFGARALHATEEDSVAKLRNLVRQLREHRVILQGDVLKQAKVLMADTRLVWSIDPSRATDSALVMLDVMGLYLDATRSIKDVTPEAELRDAAADTLQAHFEGPFGRWLATEVLALPRTQPLERRLAVAKLFETNNVPIAKLALLSCTRENEPRIRRAARRALVGWGDDAVHACFLDELERKSEAIDTEALALAEKHFASVHFAPGSKVVPRYVELVRTALVADDWRTASRAIVLQSPLDNETAVPALIEALSVWHRRAEAGAQSLRVRFELQRALRERLGRKFGMDAEEWREWWALVRSGQIAGQSPKTQGGIAESTEASFFGVRPMSDRIVFVIDRSGSMQSAFGMGTTGASNAGLRRWDEAENQLLGFLEAIGPKARFDVILFHDIAESWRGSLVPTSKDNLKAVREWLRFQRPNGGTQLRAGVDLALHTAPDGAIDLAKIEADTVIVLCDGETAEGAAWVEPFLERILPTTRMVFHGVQVGSQGDETLSKLACGSRGDFVRIDG